MMRSLCNALARASARRAVAHTKKTLTLISVCLLGASSSMGFADGAASANYAMPSSVLNAGTGPMSSSSFTLRSSLGDAVFGGASTSASYRLSSGLWPRAFGVGQICVLDLDGNGKIDALTDGVMLIRAMLGLTGSAVTSGAVGVNASRTTWAQIQPAFQLAAYNIDGNASAAAATDGVMLVRAMFGMTGANVTAGSIGGGAARDNWAAVRSFVNATCGSNFAP